MRSRHLLAILVCGAFATVASAVNLQIIVQGLKIGTGEADIRSLPNGNVQFTISMNIQAQGIKAAYKATEIGRVDGMPVSETESRDDNGTKTETVRIYGPKSVTIKITTGGQTTSKTVPYPKTGSIKTPSNAWFLKFKPKVGTTFTGWTLNDQTYKWEQETTTYTGDQEILVAGKTVKAHLITHTKGRMYLDDKGVPYRIELNEGGSNIVMERS